MMNPLDTNRQFVSKIILLLLAGACFPLCAGAASPLALPAAQKGIPAPDVFSHSRTFPSISNGYLISFSRTITAATPSNIVLTSLVTQTQIIVPFSLGQAATVILYDAGVTANNHVVLSGEYLATGTGAKVQFYATVDFLGNVVSIVNTGSYSPEHVCASAGGGVWTLGQDWALETGGGNYNLINYYSEAGVLKGSYLPRNSMRPQLVNFYPPGLVFGETVSQAFLTCTDTSLGLYLGYPSNTWTEIQAETGAMTRYKITPFLNARMTGMAVIDNNVVYGSFEIQNGAGGFRGLYSLQTTQTHTAAWAPVRDAATNGLPFSILLGGAENTLVFTRGAQGKPLIPIIYLTQ